MDKCEGCENEAHEVDCDDCSRSYEDLYRKKPAVYCRYCGGELEEGCSKRSREKEDDMTWDEIEELLDHVILPLIKENDD